MPGASRRKYYWDASLFLAWLKSEPLDPNEIAGIEEVVRSYGGRTRRNLKATKVKKSMRKPMSLYPLKFDEVISDVLKVSPEPKKERGKASEGEVSKRGGRKVRD